MNILFLTLGRFESINQYSLYTDLLRMFSKEGHFVYVLSSKERRDGGKTLLINEDNVKILKVRIGNITKTNLIEKGISTILIENQYISAIKKYFSNVTFDLVIYSTPPITYGRVVDFIKKRDCAKSYLLLKDIFPQNAVDIGILDKKGFKGFIYRYFREKEKILYKLSDRIGCMSQANCDYILQHNQEIKKDIVDICPNSIEVRDFRLDNEHKKRMRNKYDIPLDKRIFVYGGNLGKPQGISFLIECLKMQKHNQDIYFLIVGDGTEFKKIKAYIENEKPRNVKLINKLPKEDYDRMIASCDVGMIFLDYRFTIPNFPSRMLSYMQAGIPIFACTDVNSDIGKVITEGEFGWWCESKDSSQVSDMLRNISNCYELDKMGRNAYEYLCKYYSVDVSYRRIMENLVDKRK